MNEKYIRITAEMDSINLERNPMTLRDYNDIVQDELTHLLARELIDLVDITRHPQNEMFNSTVHSATAVLISEETFKRLKEEGHL